MRPLRLRPRPRPRTLQATFVAAAVLAALAAPSSLTSAAAEDDPGEPPLPPPGPTLAVKAPARQVVTTYGSDPVQQVPISARLVAGAEPVVVHSNRSSYTEPIRTVWKGPDGDVVIPNAMTTFGPLRKMIRLTVYKAGTTEIVSTSQRPVCLSTGGQRIRPDAPAYSPYPRTECYLNPYSLGQVQGLQAGWSSQVLGYETGPRLAPGRYTVEIRLTTGYARAFGVNATETRAVSALRVHHRRNYPDDCEYECRRGGGQAGARQAPVTPNAAEPAGQGAAPADGPKPDLRSLPAWGMSLNGNGKYLAFAATVWNAGESPLVVDGFRRDGEDEMDSYQYFFDSDGNQTSYQHVGHMHWDERPTHSHWHFEDFATYTLLDANKKLVRTSGKEAFCLANTDAVDLSVPGAAWEIYNEDLETSCGEESSLSVRQVLASGWGDTYTQIRAGQSFNISKLPDGTYFVAVTANPDNRLVETTTANNRSLRRIVLDTRNGKRTLRVGKVGMVVEPPGYWEK